MPAYVIVEVEIHDAVSYETYKKLTPDIIARFGGKFIVRSTSAESLEGDWQPQRLVVLQFENVSKAKEWWASQEYSEAKTIRQAAASTKMLIVDGYNG